MTPYSGALCTGNTVGWLARWRHCWAAIRAWFDTYRLNPPGAAFGWYWPDHAVAAALTGFFLTRPCGAWSNRSRQCAARQSAPPVSCAHRAVQRCSPQRGIISLRTWSREGRPKPAELPWEH